MKTIELKRIIGLVTALAVAWTDLAGPAAAAHIWAERRSARQTGPARVAALPMAEALGRVTQTLAAPRALPADHPDWTRGWDLASVQWDKSLPKERPDVVLVRDLHAQEEAQKRISAFLSSLAAGGRPVLVGVEGASGAMDFRPFRAVASVDAVRRVADAYLNWDWIQAPEHAGLTGPETLRFVGVETPGFYDGNVAAYRRAAALKPQVRAELDKASVALGNLKKTLFTPAQAALDIQAVLYRTGRLDTGDYLDVLAKSANLAARDARFPHVQRFLQARSAERALDFSQAERERADLIRRLSGLLPEERLRALTDDALLLRQGGRDAGTFHASLLKAASSAGLAAESFPAFRAYADYVAQVDRLDRQALLDEVSRLEAAAWTAQKPTPAQANVHDLSQDLALAERLSSHALTDEEWSLWEKRLPALRDLGARLTAAGAAADIDFPLESFEAFYRFAKRRDGAMLDNFLAARRAGDTSVLVAGGFHAEGITRALRERGLRAVVLTPRIEALNKDKNALDVFTRGPSPLDRLLLGQRIFMAQRAGMGLTAAPEKGSDNYKKPAVFPLLASLVDAVQNPDGAADAFARGREAAAASDAMPMDDFALQGPMRLEKDGMEIPLSARNAEGGALRLVASTGAESVEGKTITPAPIQAQTADGKTASLSVTAVPTPGDRAGWAGRLLLPGIDVLLGVSAFLLAGNPWAALAAPAVFRAGFLLNGLMNEWSHGSIGAALGYGRKAVNAANLRGNLSWNQILLTLVPMTPPMWAAMTTRFEKSDEDVMTVKRGGFWAGLLFSSAAGALAHAALGQSAAGQALLAAYAVGALAALAGSFITDMTALTGYAFDKVADACGNVFMMGHLRPDEKTAFPPRVREVARRTITINQSRGGQSGGGTVLTRPRRRYMMRGFRNVPFTVRNRRVNSRRGDLAEGIVREINAAVGHQPSYDGVYVSQVHTRYATGSVTMLHEAHPHEWKEYSGAKDDRLVWTLPNPNSVMPTEAAQGAAGRLMLSKRPVQHTITHNGDNDELKIQGVAIPFNKQGDYFERVLGTPTQWDGDSPMIAGAMELFATQGMWAESLRLAFQETLAPPFDPASIPEKPKNATAKELKAWKKQVKMALARFPAPDQDTLKAWADLAGKVLSAAASKSGFIPAGAKSLSDVPAEARAQLKAALADELRRHPSLSGFSQDKLDAFFQTAVRAFLDHDVYTALQLFKGRAEGTYGLIFQSTLEPGVVVACAHNQPLSMGFKSTVIAGKEYSDVAIMSEPSTLKVLDENGDMAYDHRLDLNNSEGEIVRIDMTRGPGHKPLVRIHSLSDGRDFTARELSMSGRMIPLKNNPYVTPLPKDPQDLINADIKDTPKVMSAADKSMKDPSSFNGQTLEAFADILFSREKPRIYVVGIASDHDLGRQFADNFRKMFSDAGSVLDKVEIVTLTGNEVLAEPWKYPVDKNTMVLAVSQSGQDFPSYAGLQVFQRQMESVDNDAAFALTGELDTLMGQVVGQNYMPDAPFSRRIFTNMAGWRPSEVATVTVEATQLILNDLLLSLARRALRERNSHGLRLSEPQLTALEKRRDFWVYDEIPQTAGSTASGQRIDPRDAVINSLIGEVARKTWSRAILENKWSLMGVYMVLQFNIAVAPHWFPNVALLPSKILTGMTALAQMVWPSAGPWMEAAWPSAGRWLGLLGDQANVHFYFLLGGLLVWMIRKAQGRTVLARQGMRQILIAEGPYAHKVLWRMMHRMLANSFGFASAYVHSENNRDHLIIDFGPQAGTLSLHGIADVAMEHSDTYEIATRSTAMQYRSSTVKSRDAGAEVVTFGHAPSISPSATDAHVALPQAPRPAKEISSPELAGLWEDMFDTWGRVMAEAVFLNKVAEHISKTFPIKYDRWHTKDQVFQPTTRSPVSPKALALLKKKAKPMRHDKEVSLPFEVMEPETVVRPAKKAPKPAPREEIRAEEPPATPRTARPEPAVQPLKSVPPAPARPATVAPPAVEPPAPVFSSVPPAPERTTERPSARPPAGKTGPDWTEARTVGLDTEGQVQFELEDIYVMDGGKLERRSAKPFQSKRMQDGTKAAMLALHRTKVNVMRFVMNDERPLQEAAGWEGPALNLPSAVFMSLTRGKISMEEAVQQGVWSAGKDPRDHGLRLLHNEEEELPSRPKLESGEVPLSRPTNDAPEPPAHPIMIVSLTADARLPATTFEVGRAQSPEDQFTLSPGESKVISDLADILRSDKRTRHYTAIGVVSSATSVDQLPLDSRLDTSRDSEILFVSQESFAVLAMSGDALSVDEVLAMQREVRPPPSRVPAGILSLLPLLISSGVLSALAGAAKAGAAAVAGVPSPADGISSTLTTLATAASLAVLFTAWHRRARASRAAAPSVVRPLLQDIRPATVTPATLAAAGTAADKTAMTTARGLAPEVSARTPALIVHASLQSAPAWAALVAAETTARRGRSLPPPPLFLVTQGDADAVRAAFFRALETWQNAEGLLTPEELTWIRRTMKGGPVSAFRTGAVNDQDMWDGQRLVAAAAAALGRPAGTAWVLATDRRGQWSVPKNLEDKLLVLDLVMPGIVSVLNMPFAAWRAAATAA